MRYYLLTRPRTNLVFYWTVDYQPTLIHLYPHRTVGDATRSADGARGGGGVRGGRGDGKSASKQFNVMHSYIKSILQHFFHNTTRNNSGDKLAEGTISTGHVSSTFALWRRGARSVGPCGERWSAHSRRMGQLGGSKMQLTTHSRRTERWGRSKIFPTSCATLHANASFCRRTLLLHTPPPQ